ncbi:hypothetical protein ASC61_14375 [Aeromicrobium sp. Root344]|uniref:DUF429 domain-containing protein n=1 Tax=Aeromicrobium sp. Root344 TaxID=1736521 RepID=UPI0006F76CC7|nr:DUF429 domain-containing protein [Aeromicrobium sp. Root344]KQV76094.1 hypothetical protein ASC61_14375 [Aeromicrobium sp. Root344]
MTVLGVDGCPVGWVGVAWGDDVTTFVALDIEQLVREAMSHHAIEVVAIDTPIGLSSDGDRAPEAYARRRLPGRASTVFSSPALGALRAETYDEANAANKAALGKGLSRQAFGILPKIADVHDWLATGPAVPVIEVHPEVCFAAMNGAVVRQPKRTAAGAAIRRELLGREGLVVPATRVRGAAPDDVVDAAAAAWTARRFADGVAERLPPEPRDHVAPAIWA